MMATKMKKRERGQDNDDDLMKDEQDSIEMRNIQALIYIIILDTFRNFPGHSASDQK